MIIKFNIIIDEDKKQLVKSSGSVGANYIEANEKLGDKDFLFRVKIARKEAKESKYWLMLLNEMNAELREISQAMGMSYNDLTKMALGSADLDKKMKEIFMKMAVPNVVSGLVLTIYSIVDGIFIGLFVGPEGLAAINLCLPIIGFSVAIKLLRQCLLCLVREVPCLLLNF
mgnify:CR=1 FL=1